MKIVANEIAENLEKAEQQFLPKLELELEGKSVNLTMKKVSMNP